MYTVYILQSLKNNRYYVGHTSNIEKRLLQHNSGLTYSTRNHIPWKIVYQKEFNSKSIAQHFELKIKKMKSRQFIEKLIANIIDETFFT